MPTPALSNPLGTNLRVPDFRKGVDEFGGELTYGKDVYTYRANVNIARGQAVKFVAATQSTPVSVTPTTGASGLDFAGIANVAAKAGNIVEVTRHGHALAIAAGNTTGIVNVTTATGGKVATLAVDATTVLGGAIGCTTSDGATDTLVPVYLP